MKDFAGESDRIPREQFPGRERQNESHSGEEENIYSLRHKLRGRRSGGGLGLLKERNIDSWKEILLQI